MSNENKDDAPTYDNTWYRTGVDGRDMPALHVQHHDNSQRAETSEKPRFGPNDSGAAMLKPVETRIAQIRGQLAEAVGFDPATGGQNFRYATGSRERANLERELLQLEGHTLPLTRRMAAEADAYLAAEPTREDKNLAELQRQKAIRARAQTLADEAEALDHAKRIARSRGLTMT